LESHYLSNDAASLVEEADSQSSHMASRDIILDTSIGHGDIVKDIALGFMCL